MGSTEKARASEAWGGDRVTALPSFILIFRSSHRRTTGRDPNTESAKVADQISPLRVFKATLREYSRIRATRTTMTTENAIITPPNTTNLAARDRLRSSRICPNKFFRWSIENDYRGAELEIGSQIHASDSCQAPRPALFGRSLPFTLPS